MGYNTDFSGEFKIEPKLKEDDLEFLTRFNRSRRMARQGLGPEHGIEGEWFVDDNDSESIINSNKAPCRQPGLWCQWVPNKEGTALKWDQGEKAYDMEIWIEYLLE